MKKLLLLFAVLFLTMFLHQPVLAQTAEQAKKAHVEKALATGDGKIIKEKVDTYSKKYGVEPALVHAVILTESGYNKNAKSPCGATGLMQLMPATFTARKVGNNIYSIDNNIHAGVKHLRGMQDRYKGNMYYALAAYNMGGGRIVSGKPLPTAAKKYVDKVYYHKKIIDNIDL